MSLLGLRLLRPAIESTRLVSSVSQSYGGNKIWSLRSTVLLTGARGMAAVKNWRTPSMELDYPPPKEYWEHVNRRRQQRYNAILAVGVAFFGFTIAFAKVSGIIQFYGTPSFAKTTGYVSKYSTDDENDGDGEKEPDAVVSSSAVHEESAKETPSNVDVSKSDKNLESNLSSSTQSLPDHIPYLLIGAGTAAFSAYRTIKAADAKAKILIIGDENRNPYMRPPLSKELWYANNSMSGSMEDIPNMRFRQWNGRDRPIYYEPEQFYTPIGELMGRENGGISVVRGRKVTKIDSDKQIAYLDDGSKITYDKCLIATGGSPKNLPIFEPYRDKVTLFRKLDDYFRLADTVKNAESLVIVGGGFLGSELACALASWGQNEKLQVTQIFPEHGNMAKVLPEYLSKWTTEKVRAEGVNVMPQTSISSVTLDEVSQKLILTTSDGGQVKADHAVIAVGIEPESDIGRASNLEMDREFGGYKVNEELEARPNLWVAGDAASFNDALLGRRRVEHHDHAVVSGKLAGENMAGGHKHFTHQSMFWSDLGPDIGYEAIGIIDSKLPTVGVFAKATKKDTPKAAASISGDNLRISETETSSALATPSANQANSEDKAEDYGKGVIFYLRDNIVVGVLMWNVFNKISLARKVIKEHKHYDDLSEVAKLFELHKSEEEQAQQQEEQSKAENKSNDDK